MFYSIGIDVSKATLQVYIPIRDINITISNTSKGLQGLWAKLKKYYKKDIQQILFVFEPTGTYSTLLKHFCADHNIMTFIVNPRQSSNFSKALANRSKTDPIDAQMLSQMASMAHKSDIKVPLIDPLQESLTEILGYYKLIQKQRKSIASHLEALEAKVPMTDTVKRLKIKMNQLKEEEELILQEMMALIQSNDTLSEGFENIQSISGVGKISALILLHLFITYPHANRQQISALCGLDVVESISGTSLKTKPRISKKGNALYRSILFMPVLSSVRTNPYFKSFYNRLKENGKHTTQAQIAVMKKTILIAHALYRKNQKFDPLYYEKSIGWNHEIA